MRGKVKCNMCDKETSEYNAVDSDWCFDPEFPLDARCPTCEEQAERESPIVGILDEIIALQTA